MTYVPTSGRLSSQIVPILNILIEHQRLGGNASPFVEAAATEITGIIHDRIVGLIRYNSEQVVRRRALKVRLDIALKAMGEVDHQLAKWLTDNTEQVFEEEPEIDGARSAIHDALEAIAAVREEDFGRP